MVKIHSGAGSLDWTESGVWVNSRYNREERGRDVGPEYFFVLYTGAALFSMVCKQRANRGTGGMR